MCAVLDNLVLQYKQCVPFKTPVPPNVFEICILVLSLSIRFLLVCIAEHECEQNLWLYLLSLLLVTVNLLLHSKQFLVTYDVLKSDHFILNFLNN